MAVTSAVEQFAFAAVRRILNVEVEEYDVGVRQAAVDGMIHYPDGRAAALEVSSMGPEAEARITNTLDGQARREVNGLQRTWWVEVPRDFHPADLGRVDAAALRCEAERVDHFDQATDQAIEKLRKSGVRGWTADQVSPMGPAVFVLVAGIWGFTSEGAENLPDELDAALGEPTMQSKIEKLASTGLEERHLFLHVRPSAFSFPVYASLAFGGPLPVTRPHLPGGLSQVWLLSGWKDGGVVRAINGAGWARTEIGD